MPIQHKDMFPSPITTNSPATSNLFAHSSESNILFSCSNSARCKVGISNKSKTNLVQRVLVQTPLLAPLLYFTTSCSAQTIQFNDNDDAIDICNYLPVQDDLGCPAPVRGQTSCEEVKYGRGSPWRPSQATRTHPVTGCTAADLSTCTARLQTVL